MKYIYAFILGLALVGPSLAFADNPIIYTLTVSTSSVSSVSSTGATLQGSYDGSQPSTVWFAYGTSSGNLQYSTNSQSVAAGTGSYYATLSGLSSNTTYYYQAVGTLAGVTHYGQQILNFTTSNGSSYNDAPSVTTDNAENVQEDRAQLRGVVNPNGSSTRVWFEYGDDTNMNESTDDETIGSTTYSQDVAMTVYDLDEDQTYYFRLCALNSYGTICGDRENFRTDDSYDNNDDNDNYYYNDNNYPYNNNNPYYYNPMPPVYTPDYTTPTPPTIIYNTPPQVITYNTAPYPENTGGYVRHAPFSNAAYGTAVTASAYGAGYGLSNVWVILIIILIIFAIAYIARRGTDGR